MLDVPVALIFFIRPDTLKRVFEKVKKAKPSKLFLIQDGPRDEVDAEKIKLCREIVEDIDWPCEVFKNYSDKNLGCGQRPYTGITWVFENVDRAIILEDDCVPSDTFFRFCEEMLDRYEYDTRVGIISGTNRFGKYDFGGYSYGFSKAAGIGGWATWKTRWEKYNFLLSQYDNEYIRRCLKADITPKQVAIRRIRRWCKARDTLKHTQNVSFWDYQWSFVRHINSWVSIVPEVNQITNIGYGEGATHTKTKNTKRKDKFEFFDMEAPDLRFPLIHPEFLLPNRIYDTDCYKILYPNIFKRVIGKVRQYLNN